VLTKEDLHKLLKRKGKEPRAKDLAKAVQPIGNMLEKCKSDLSVFKSQFESFIGASPTAIAANLKRVTNRVDSLIINLEIINDNTAVKKMQYISRSLTSLQGRIETPDVVKLTEVREKLISINASLQDIVILEEASRGVDREVEILKKLKPATIENNIQYAFIQYAPLILVLETALNPKTARILSDKIKLKSVGPYYYYASSAQFIIFNTSKGSKKYPIEDQVIQTVRLLNRRTRKGIIPILDISTSIREYFVIWVCPESMAKSLSYLTEKINDFSILLK
jgi:hypothetical protein